MWRNMQWWHNMKWWWIIYDKHWTREQLRCALWIKKQTIYYHKTIKKSYKQNQNQLWKNCKKYHVYQMMMLKWSPRHQKSENWWKNFQNEQHTFVHLRKSNAKFSLSVRLMWKKKLAMNARHVKKIEKTNVKTHSNLKIIKLSWTKWIVNKKMNKTTLRIEINNLKTINKLICKKLFNEYGWGKCVETTRIKSIEQCFNCYQYGHINKMCWRKMVCEYCVEKHKSNKCEISFNQHSIKCVLCEKKHMTWSFKCLKRRKKNKLIAKNAKTAELYIIKTIRSEFQQSLNKTKNAYPACSNTINKKNPSDWKIMTKKKWNKTDNPFAFFDVIKVTIIKMNSMKLDFKKKPQNSVKKPMNHLKKSMQSSQTMFVNTQPKDFQFSTNRMMFDVFQVCKMTTTFYTKL